VAWQSVVAGVLTPVIVVRVVSEKVPPYAVRVGDILLPKPLSGHPALELCNTVAGWNEPRDQRKEWLTTPDRLATWAEFAGLVERRPRVDGVVLEEFRELREVAYRLLGHRDDSAFPALAEKADAANALRRLTRDGGFRLPPSDDPRLPVHAAALAVADLLARPERDTVRACPGEGCGWLFLDPRGRRTWCTMAVCGNRAKVRAYATRHQTG
jgi:predicted RNA-binding Zn ribbon-like protein